MRGMGSIYKRGPVYWIRFHHRGREYRESTRSKVQADAVRLLKLRLAALGQGGLAGPDEERVTFGSGPRGPRTSTTSSTSGMNGAPSC